MELRTRKRPQLHDFASKPDNILQPAHQDATPETYLSPRYYVKAVSGELIEHFVGKGQFSGAGSKVQRNKDMYVKMHP